MDEIEHVLSGEPAVMADRGEHVSETRYNAVGRNREGRHLFIVFVIRHDAGLTLLRPVSARYMHAREVMRYAG
jgi:hypothetical protein